LATDIETDLEARLYVAHEGPYPVRLEVRISVTIMSENEFERGGSVMRVQRTQEGVFEQTVEVEKVMP